MFSRSTIKTYLRNLFILIIPGFTRLSNFSQGYQMNSNIQNNKLEISFLLSYQKDKLFNPIQLSLLFNCFVFNHKKQYKNIQYFTRKCHVIITLP